MRIYTDIGHPAHFHFMRNIIRQLQQHGHTFLITAREKDITTVLLREANIPYISRGGGAHSFSGRIFYFLKFLFGHLHTIHKFNPDLCIGIGSPYLVVAARLLGVPGIVFEDTESATRVNLIYRLFATRVITPDCFKGSFGKKHIRINGFKESAYLHRNHFKPDPGIYKELGLVPGEKYIVLRFVSHRVNHDKPFDGLTDEMKKTLVENLLKQGRVFISSEKGIPVPYPELELQVPPDRMHHVIAFAGLVVGESATMAAEAALLGVPAVFFDNHGRGYTDELEQVYHLVSNYTVTEENADKGIARAQEILSTPGYVKTYTLYHQLVEGKIDVTEFMVRFAEEFPAGLKSFSQIGAD